MDKNKKIIIGLILVFIFVGIVVKMSMPKQPTKSSYNEIPVGNYMSRAPKGDYLNQIIDMAKEGAIDGIEYERNEKFSGNIKYICSYDNTFEGSFDLIYFCDDGTGCRVKVIANRCKIENEKLIFGFRDMETYTMTGGFDSLEESEKNLRRSYESYIETFGMLTSEIIESRVSQ